jgi:hypothetical protein
MPANDTQIGGTHYKNGGEEHWDRAYRLRYDCFQYIITKWIERWRSKGGIQDLEKAEHAIKKYIEVARAEALAQSPARCFSDPLRDSESNDEGGGSGYVEQDSRC